MSTYSESRSLPDLFSSLVNEATTLFRQEFRLARTEASEKAGLLTGAVLMLGAAAVIVIPALVLVFEAIAYFVLLTGLTIAWATLAVGLFFLLVGFILLMIGIGRLRASNLKPQRTIRQVQQDAALAKEQM